LPILLIGHVSPTRSCADLSPLPVMILPPRPALEKRAKAVGQGEERVNRVMSAARCPDGTACPMAATTRPWPRARGDYLARNRHGIDVRRNSRPAVACLGTNAGPDRALWRHRRRLRRRATVACPHPPPHPLHRICRPAPWRDLTRPLLCAALFAAEACLVHRPPGSPSDLLSVQPVRSINAGPYRFRPTLRFRALS
jgi:hypothetical protein